MERELQTRQVVASLEGMRILITDDGCELHEYDFSLNSWKPKMNALWPLSKQEAEARLQGWNKIDRSTAMNMLVRVDDDQ